MYTNKYNESFIVLEQSKVDNYTLIQFSTGHIVEFPFIPPYRYETAIVNPYRIIDWLGYGYRGMTRDKSRKLDSKYFKRWTDLLRSHTADAVDEYFHSFANFYQWCLEYDIDIHNDYLAVIDKQITKLDKQRHGYMPIKVVRIIHFLKVGYVYESLAEYGRDCDLHQNSSNLSTLDNIKYNDNGDILMRYEDAIQYLEKIGGRLVDETEWYSNLPIR